MSQSSGNKWKHLGPKPGSAYRQLFIKGTRIMARIIYGAVAREEERLTPEQAAASFHIPLPAVHEAIAYCESNPPEIQEDWEREEANIRARMRAQRRAARRG